MVHENIIDLSINIILYNFKKVQSQIFILCIFFVYILYGSLVYKPLYQTVIICFLVFYSLLKINNFIPKNNLWINSISKLFIFIRDFSSHKVLAAYLLEDLSLHLKF
jgi:hypothetical protein